ncbi:MAG: hydroxymethylbilane synthase [Omnitrophica WOR_2 bacterium RIFCSPHIGHO2_02_FULL_45_21]|nr:MAG: hydroxymethylbilane synthase [Omnitrophica WOR_2 bacterium RIFCSPHIGHO2_02_FULL_45_21]
MGKTKKKIIIGARGSLLSVVQAKSVIKVLRSNFPAYSFCLKKITTFADKQKNWRRLDLALAVGIFVKELEEALLRKEIDLAVHSLKDLPSDLPRDLTLAAVTKRIDPRDCLIFKEKTSLYKLKKGACLGTSSLRRQAQALRIRPDLQIKHLRGNLDTRIKKLLAGEYDAIIAALAGVKRLGYAKNLLLQALPMSIFLPAPGQGALGIEARTDDKTIKTLTEKINHRKSFLCAVCERAFLREFGAGCRLALGALAEIKDRQIHLQAVVLSSNGKRIIRLSRKGALKQAGALGKQLAQQMLKKGARKLLKEV